MELRHGIKAYNGGIDMWLNLVNGRLTVDSQKSVSGLLGQEKEIKEAFTKGLDLDYSVWLEGEKAQDYREELIDLRGGAFNPFFGLNFNIVLSINLKYRSRFIY